MEFSQVLKAGPLGRGERVNSEGKHFDSGSVPRPNTFITYMCIFRECAVKYMEFTCRKEVGNYIRLGYLRSYTILFMRPCNGKYYI